MTDDELRDAYAAHLRRAQPPDARGPTSDACASLEDILTLVRGEGPEARRLAVLDHVMSCARCRAEFDMLRSVETAGRQLVEGEGAIVRPLRPARIAPALRRWPGGVGLAVAASLVLAVGVRQYRARGDTDLERGAGDAVALVAPAPGDVPAGAPLRFVWHAVPRATRYEVEVLAADGAAVASGTTADTVFALADARRLAPGTTYRWWVSAVGDDGAAARRSALRPLRVARR